MIIDDFYNTYFSNLSDTISGFGQDASHFVRIVDMQDADALAHVEQSGGSYPLMALEEFDEDEDRDESSDLRYLTIKAGFLILKSISPDDGYAARVEAVKECRLLARKVFSKMVKDSIARTGNELYENNIEVSKQRAGIYLHNAGGGSLRGYRLEFEWKVKGKLIQFEDADLQ